MRDLLSKLDRILNETALNPNNPKSDYEEKKRALDDLQRDPIAGSDPEISQAIIQRKADLEKEAKAKGIEEDIYQVGDVFGISFSEDFEIGSEIVDIVEDGIVIELDETSLEFLSQNGFSFEEVQFNEEKQKGVDGKVCWKGYRGMGTKMKGGKRVDNCVKVGEDSDIEESGLQYYLGKKKFGKDGMTALAKAGKEGASEEELGRIKDKYKKESTIDEIGEDDNEPLTFQAGDNADMTSLKGKITTSYSELVDIFGDPQFGPNENGDKVTCEWIIDFSDGEIATIYDWKEEETPMHKTQWHVGGKNNQAYWNVLEVIEKYRNLEDPKEYAEKSADLDAIEYGQKEDLELEAKYQGREVPLGKPMKGDVKKSKVYVKNAKGNVVKVNFGDKKMRIKKSNPNRRKSFRARHNCATAKDRTTARYWSCRAW